MSPTFRFLLCNTRNPFQKSKQYDSHQILVTAQVSGLKVFPYKLKGIQNFLERLWTNVLEGMRPRCLMPGLVK